VSSNTGQFKKKVTFSHVYNEVTTEPTITRNTTSGRKTLKVWTHRMYSWISFEAKLCLQLVWSINNRHEICNTLDWSSLSCYFFMMFRQLNSVRCGRMSVVGKRMWQFLMNYTGIYFKRLKTIKQPQSAYLIPGWISIGYLSSASPSHHCADTLNPEVSFTNFT
jgi:hypothetical protein